MKNPLLILTLVAFTGCSTMQSTGNKFSAWWNLPATKAKVQKVEEIAFSLAINIGLAVVQQYGETGKVNLNSAAIAAGANTLYQQASALRQIQGTAQVIDPNAIAAVLESNGTASDMARQIALIIAQNGSILVTSGVNPDVASERQASEFDRAAAVIMLGRVSP